MDQKEVKAISEEFINNNNKQGLYFVSAAVAAGISDELVRKYLSANLSPEMLLQMLSALADGINEKSLDVLLNMSKSASAADMRECRLSLKGDVSLDVMAEEVHACDEHIQEIGKSIKDIQKKMSVLDQLKNKVTEMEKKVDGKPEKEEVNQKILPKEDRLKTDTIEAGLNEETLPGCDYTVYTGNQAVVIETNTEAKKTDRVRSFFRHGNKQKMVTDEEMKMQTLRDILSTEPPADKLGAIIEAGKEGIPLSFLKLYTDRNASAEQLALYTKAYLAFFGDPKPANG